MTLNTNDSLQLQLFNSIYSFKLMNPLYGSFILYMNEMGIFNLKKDTDSGKQLIAVEEYLKSNPDLFHKLLKYTIDNGFLERITERYYYNNTATRKRGEVNQFHTLKFKIINNKIFMYDMMLSSENQEMIELSKINGYPCDDILKKLLDDGYTKNQIEILLQHKEVLSSYGFNSDNQKITIANPEVEYILDSENISIDFDIFYKKHNRSQMLEKTNFSILRNSESKDNLSYGFDSNLALLQMLHGLLKSDKDLNLLRNIYDQNISLIGNGSSMEENIDWMFISTFFLMNQEEKGDLPDYIYPDLERKLKLASNGGPWLIFLDENNQEESYGFNVTQNTCGSNSYIYDNGKYDTKKIFHAVRDALAHSSYEVVDKDYIRIYYKDDKTNNMTTNFKIKKDIIIEFIDKISKFRSFGNVFPLCSLEKPNVNNTSIKNEDELDAYLQQIIVSNINIKKYSNLDQLKQLQQYARLLEHASNPDPMLYNDNTKLSDSLEYDFITKIQYLKSRVENPMCRSAKEIRMYSEQSLKIFADYDYSESKLNAEQIESIKKQILQFKDVFYSNSAYNQHSIITELVRNEVNPNRNISSIIADIVSTDKKENGNIMDTLDESASKYIDYEKIVKATIIAYLNNVLLYNFNENNIDCSGLDFTRMLKNLQPLIDVKENDIKGKKAERGNKRKTIVKNEKRIGVLDRIIENNPNSRENNVNEKNARIQENNKLSENISNLDRIIQTLELEVENIKQNGIVDNYYVLEHLRNSLAHGNIYFSDVIDLNNICDLEVTFVDYYPKKREDDVSVESFRGTIKFGELLSTLNNEKYVASLFSKKDNPTLS